MVQITETILLHPKYLTTNFQQSILQILNDTKVNTCTKKYGYIDSIESVSPVSTSDTIVSLVNSWILVNVTYEAKTTKPEVGQRLIGKVIQVYEQGVFVQVGIIRILVIGGRYENKTCFVGDKSYKIGDDLEFEIIQIEFKDNKFSCVAKHI